MTEPAAAARWQQRLEAAWWQPASLPAWHWRALSTLFGGLVRLRRALYQHGWLHSDRLDVPVIVVGNRIVGGAGKTPTTVALVEALRLAGWHPGIVSRGHGRQGTAPCIVRPSSLASEVGDEPLLMARRTGVPLWVGRDRAAAGRCLRQAHPEVDVIVCDDGLQHLRLARDIELVVFDDRGSGNGRLLPAGPLREPLEAPSLARHQQVIYNARQASTPLRGRLAQRALAAPQPLADWQAGRPAQDDAWTTLTGRPLWALAGIGAPERFFTDLRARGLTLPPTQALAMPDHAVYDTLPWPDTAADLLVTEKDAVKLAPARLARERPGTAVWVVPLRYTLPPELVSELLAWLARQPPPPTHPA